MSERTTERRPSEAAGPPDREVGGREDLSSTDGTGRSPTGDDRGYPRYRSHLLPRTRSGWIGVVLFLSILALAEPPFLDWANRIEPWILGMPFLFAYLLGVYCALIGVLLWIQRRRL